jgi:hypothetical protein
MNGNIQTNISLPIYREVVADFPDTLTATTTAKPLFAGNAPYRWVTAWSVRVRSMGTATYVALGSRLAQPWRLITVGQTYGANGNPGEVFDLSQIYVISDTSDAVIEITNTYLPIPMYGNVILAQNQR